MSLLNSIKSAQLQARKTRDTITINALTTLIGEAEAIGKNDGNRETTDAEVVALIKKFIKNLDEVIRVVTPGFSHDQLARKEKVILEQFLPTQLTSVELRGILKELTNELNAHTLREMGKIMKVLKERFDGQYDGTVASTLVKEMLT
jgi:uncharacterized protein